MPTVSYAVPLFSIGYEGFSIDEMLGFLQREHIASIIDVRQLPLSRKKGFSKKSLADSAQKYGLRYYHIAPLGCPKPIRNRYKENKDWSEYTRAYLAYLDTQVDTLKALLTQVQGERCVLLCYEADVKTCHRLYIANALVKMNPRIQTTHLNRVSRQSLTAVAAD